MMMRISMDPADMSRREDDLGRASIVLARREIEWTAAWAAVLVCLRSGNETQFR
uniref:Expressed protein n=1 Tax=Schizophyllum commune (strain H4-8 / FGSC 9210) TaxID=578458 RepID=D8QAI3_SCHCM